MHGCAPQYFYSPELVGKLFFLLFVKVIDLFQVLHIVISKLLLYLKPNVFCLLKGYCTVPCWKEVVQIYTIGAVTNLQKWKKNGTVLPITFDCSIYSKSVNGFLKDKIKIYMLIIKLFWKRYYLLGEKLTGSIWNTNFQDSGTTRPITNSDHCKLGLLQACPIQTGTIANSVHIYIIIYSYFTNAPSYDIYYSINLDLLVRWKRHPNTPFM